MIPLFLHFFSGKPSQVSVQFFRYILVGGISAFFDTATFYCFSSLFHTHYFIAQTFGFLIGITTNYLLSIIWIFESKHGKLLESSLFLMTGLGGLLLSYLFLWVFIDILDVTAWQNLLAKILTVGIVLIWNFSSRKYFVFKSSETI